MRIETPGGGGSLTLGGQTGDTQTFATATTGNDFNVSSASNIHTFAIPSASSVNRGLVTTGAQTFGGAKSFGSTNIGRLDATELSITGVLVAGTYTPMLTAVANSTAVTYPCQYLRTGSTVVVSGKVDIDPTLTATSTQVGVTLPIASNFGNATDCAGVAFSSDVAGLGAGILGDATNNRAQIQFVASDINIQPFYFQFTYQII